MRTPVPVALAVAGLWALALGTSSVHAAPWDVGGAVPPSATPRPAQPDPNCTQSYANDEPSGGPRIAFGIGPLYAGAVGERQTPVVPEDRAKTDAALARLKGSRSLEVRLNRLFMEDGRAGIRRYRRLAHRFARLGLDVALQVRYHPAAADDGDIGKWRRFVRQVVRGFGPNEHVKFLQITNEVNLWASPNTSDGAYRRATDALVEGVVAAKRESRRLGYDHQQIGFNYAWRFDTPDEANDAAFWETLGREGGRRLRRHVDWVGVDLYPGTLVPGLLRPAPIVDIGDVFLEGIAQTRECFMPKAGFTMKTPLRIAEIGYTTGPGTPEAVQDRALREFVHSAHRYRGTYGIRGFEWFNLRDNNTAGANFQDHYGLLRDDYTRKPAFGSYRRLIERYGAAPAPSGPVRLSRPPRLLG